MLRQSSNFHINTDVSNWNVSNCKDFSQMFNITINANPNVENWNVGSGEIFNGMFFRSGMSRNLSNWNMSKAIDISEMFLGGTFIPLTFPITGIENWNVSNVTFASQFIKFRGDIGFAKYDQILINWSQQNLKPNVTIEFENCKYSSLAESARQSIIDNYNWTIIDGGLNV
jgi:hypothetical protein